MPGENVDRVEADPQKLLELQQVWAKIEELKRQAALHAPVRPRRWHRTQGEPKCPGPTTCPGCSAPRDDQLPPPGDWNIWLILSGRGWGKARRVLSG
jgi:hypothetical protein